MSPIHLSGTPVSARRPPPQLGEHTDEVLAAAGFSSDELASLRREGVVR
jgi:crotonobetainyl-CoA:carnitine CoA-transferase CaiB-like acyl-CoA transferase